MEEFNATPFTRTRPFTAPVKQQEDLEKEIRNTYEQLPVLKQVQKHLDAKIAQTDSIVKAIEIAKTYDTTTENALIALNIVTQQLAQERSYINARVERTIKR